MRGYLLDAWEEGSTVRLFVKTHDRVVLAVEENFLPYFYALPSTEKDLKTLERVELTEKGRIIRPVSVHLERKKLKGEPVEAAKILVEKQADIEPLRHFIRDAMKLPLFEYDLPLLRRYFILRGLWPFCGVELKGKEEAGIFKLLSPPRPVDLPEPELNILAFDIEVYNPAGSPRVEVDPVIMISLADTKGLRKVLTWKGSAGLDFVEELGGEKEMLARFIELVRERDPDILVGYNTDLFDFPYLRRRAELLGVKLTLGREGSEPLARRRRFASATRVEGRVHCDLYAMVNFLALTGAIRLIHYTLGEVYKYLSGKEKPELEFTEIAEAWDGGGEKYRKLLEYSMGDAQAALELAQELLPLFLQLAKVIGQSLFDVCRMTPGQMVEWLLIREAHARGELVPPRPIAEEMEEREEETYVGAYVMEPEKGMHEDLVVFDFRSLYPSIIITHRIDPFNLNCSCCGKGEGTIVPELGYRFCSRKEGFIVPVLQRLVEERLKLKAQLKGLEKDSGEYRLLFARQNALKIITNSFYGMLGFSRARWYSKECAESITSFGRCYIHKTIDMARNFGFKVIYGDTDSLHCKLDGKTREDASKFLRQVNEELPGMIELELEGFYPRGVYLTKKRYALIDEKGRLTVKGLEFVRRDWAGIAKKTQEKVLDAILREGSPSKAFEIIHKTIQELREQKIPLEDLIIYTQLKMSLDEYKAVGPHVAVARKLRERGKPVEPGMMIAYVEAKGVGSISDRAFSVEEFKEKKLKYDPDYYINHQVLPAVMRIMEALGYTEEDLRSEGKQVSLGKFLK
ncbi:MAG: DNA-directed DNA polymerase [Candidatus Hadarchaeales archaeon]